VTLTINDDDAKERRRGTIKTANESEASFSHQPLQG
jgi:hypothetical protein